MRLTFVQKLTPWIVCRLAASRVGSVLYFDSSVTAEWWARQAERLTRGSTTFEPAEWRFEELACPDGLSPLREIRLAILVACETFVDRARRNDHVVRRLGRTLDFERLLLLYRKITAQEMYEPTVQLYAADWIRRSRGLGRDDRADFFYPRREWGTDYARIAEGIGLAARPYRESWLVGAFGTVIARVTRPRLAPGATETAGPAASASPSETTPPSPRVGVGPYVLMPYYGPSTAVLDPASRGVFFMYAEEALPPGQVLAFATGGNTAENGRITLSDVNALHESGIELAAFPGAGADPAAQCLRWAPGKVQRDLRMGLTLQAGVGALGGTVRLAPPSLRTLQGAAYAVKEYSRWTDFLAASEVKVLVYAEDYNKASVLMHTALRDLGGVGISYLWSHHSYPTVDFATAADIAVVFGPHDEKLYRENGSTLGRIVQVGYVADQAAAAVRERSATLRAKLESRGAEYVIAYFDENSSDDRMSLISHQHASSVYASLLQHVIDDPTLGLIVKPKRPSTLVSRLGEIAELLDRARATGRCHLFDEGGHRTPQYPVEASLAADLCVGSLLGRTAVLEATVAGVPAVLLDTERTGLTESDGGLENGVTVFSDTGEFFKALATFREAGQPVGFGELSRWAEDKAAFVDGKASRRAGRFVSDILCALEEGDEPEKAMADVCDAYEEVWGHGTAAVV